MQETNFLDKLSSQAKKLGIKVHNSVKSYGKLTSELITLNYLNDNYKPISETKSMISKQLAYDYNPSTNYIEVLLGKPGLDEQNEITTENFWKNGVKEKIKGDVEHYYKFKGDGLKVQDNPEYEGWVSVLEDTWFDEESGYLKGNVSYPVDHPYTNTFLTKWKNGEFGVSIEQKTLNSEVTYDDEFRPIIDSGDIYRFTFTESPAIDTKPKSL